MTLDALFYLGNDILTIESFISQVRVQSVTEFVYNADMRH